MKRKEIEKFFDDIDNLFFSDLPKEDLSIKTDARTKKSNGESGIQRGKRRKLRKTIVDLRNLIYEGPHENLGLFEFISHDVFVEIIKYDPYNKKETFTRLYNPKTGELRTYLYNFFLAPSPIYGNYLRYVLEYVGTEDIYTFLKNEENFYKDKFDLIKEMWNPPPLGGEIDERDPDKKNFHELLVATFSDENLENESADIINQLKLTYFIYEAEEREKRLNELNNRMNELNYEKFKLKTFVKESYYLQSWSPKIPIISTNDELFKYYKFHNMISEQISHNDNNIIISDLELMIKNQSIDAIIFLISSFYSNKFNNQKFKENNVLGKRLYILRRMNIFMFKICGMIINIYRKIFNDVIKARLYSRKFFYIMFYQFYNDNFVIIFNRWDIIFNKSPGAMEYYPKHIPKTFKDFINDYYKEFNTGLILPKYEKENYDISKPNMLTYFQTLNSNLIKFDYNNLRKVVRVIISIYWCRSINPIIENFIQEGKLIIGVSFMKTLRRFNWIVLNKWIIGYNEIMERVKILEHRPIFDQRENEIKYFDILEAFKLQDFYDMLIFFDKTEKEYFMGNLKIVY